MRNIIRSVFVAASILALVLGFSTAAVAAPKVTEAAFTNPVAYELKSLLTTRFYCTVDTPSWATLTVSGAKGVVKTVYSGPVNTTGKRVHFPAWNGLDASGKRLPSASYDWKLVMSKGSQKTTVTGKITISKINFVIRGARSSDSMIHVSADRYMLPGTANVYVTVRADRPGGIMSVWGPRLPSDGARPLVYSLFDITGTKTQHTAYLRKPPIPSRGMYRWQVRVGRHFAIPARKPGEPAPPPHWAEFDITVIQ